MKNNGRFEKGHIMSKKMKDKISNSMKNKIDKGEFFNEEHRRKISESKKGNKNAMFGVSPSEETRVKRSISLKGKIPWNKGKKWPEKSGKNAPGWKGGVSTEHEILRHSLEYRLWRTAVFERDDYTCIWCGERGGELNADHIKPFAYYPELRFAIDNGRTLCVDCHKTTDTYARKEING